MSDHVLSAAGGKDGRSLLFRSRESGKLLPLRRSECLGRFAHRLNIDFSLLNSQCRDLADGRVNGSRIGLLLAGQVPQFGLQLLNASAIVALPLSGSRLDFLKRFALLWR